MLLYSLLASTIHADSDYAGDLDRSELHCRQERFPSAEIARIDVGVEPFGVEVDSARNLLYVTLYGENKLVAVDVDTWEKVDSLTVGSKPLSLVLIESSSLLLVGNYESSTISLIDVSKWSVITELPAGSGPRETFKAPFSQRVFCVCNGDSTCYEFDMPSGGRISRTFSGYLLGGAVDPSEKWLYLVNTSEHGMYRIALRGPEVIDFVHCGVNPNLVAVSGDSKNLWVTNTGEHTVAVIDRNSFKKRLILPCGRSPSGIAIFSRSISEYYVYILNAGDDTVFIFDSDGRKAASLPVGRFPIRAACGRNMVCVTNRFDNSMSIIGFTGDSP
jgi:DNA-binding beta-propeller fold protein YncE